MGKGGGKTKEGKIMKKVFTKARLWQIGLVVVGLIIYSEISGFYAKGREAVIKTIKGA